MENTCSKCDNVPRAGQRYCNPCFAEWARLNRPRHSQLSDEAKKKANSRSYLNVYLRREHVKKGSSCEICGNQQVQAHHENYNRPLEVSWLCRPCHLDLHKRIGKGDRKYKIILESHKCKSVNIY